MRIDENVSLSDYSTMRLGGEAKYLAEAHNEDELKELIEWATSNNVKFIVLGGGSNVVWRDEGFDGLVIINKICGREVIKEDDNEVVLEIGSGEIWDEVVQRTVENGWSGIEFLSLIPGTVGAAPVQNIGAYGAELSEILLGVEVYDTHGKCLETLMNEACGFDYRTSRFKTTDRGRFIITGITIKLSKKPPAPPFYDALTKYFQEHPVDHYTPAIIREAVIAIRSSKLPDPKWIANNGSFFTNPIVEQAKFDELKQKYPEIKGWPTEGGKVKIAAGWLVEQAGFKGVHDEQTGMATWADQALVLVNEHARSTADLLAFKQKIVDAVEQKFGITLEQEPELLP
jgi:UDP-N-acetylmuramate dehydrogenase